MRDAIALLNVAKKAEKPVPLLQKARKALLNARHNKGSERVDAIRAINEAIAYAQINDKKKMMAQINHAIAECHGGMAHAR